MSSRSPNAPFASIITRLLPAPRSRKTASPRKECVDTSPRPKTLVVPYRASSTDDASRTPSGVSTDNVRRKRYAPRSCPKSPQADIGRTNAMAIAAFEAALCLPCRFPFLSGGGTLKLCLHSEDVFVRCFILGVSERQVLAATTVIQPRRTEPVQRAVAELLCPGPACLNLFGVLHQMSRTPDDLLANYGDMKSIASSFLPRFSLRPALGRCEGSAHALFEVRDELR